MSAALAKALERRRARKSGIAQKTPRKSSKEEKFISSLTRTAFKRRKLTSATDWMRKHYMIPGTSSSLSSRWNPKPYQIGMCDLMGTNERNPRRIIFPKSVRVGYTVSFTGVAIYTIVRRRKHVKIHLPTDEVIDKYSVTTAEPALQACAPAKAAMETDIDGRRSANKFRKIIGGKQWVLAGTSGKTIIGDSGDVLFVDEVNNMNSTVDGISLVKNIWRAVRVSPFRRMILGGAPGLGSEILREEDEKSDLRLEFAIVCPNKACKSYISLVWENFRYDGVREYNPDRTAENERRAATVVYKSQCCGHEWRHEQLYESMKKGRWQTENGTHLVTGSHDPYLVNAVGKRVPMPKQITMFIWGAYFPEITWPEIILEWLQAQLSQTDKIISVSYTHLTLPTIYSV